MKLESRELEDRDKKLLFVFVQRGERRDFCRYQSGKDHPNFRYKVLCKSSYHVKGRVW